MNQTSRTRLRALTAAVLVTGLGVVAPQVWAPPQKAEAFPLDALSFGSTGHGQITRLAVRRFLSEIYGVTAPDFLMEQANTEIANSNEAVDSDQISSAKHFDGENFAGGKNVIAGHLSFALNASRTGVPAGARISLGAALHTIQDFYAHSNWVELGKTSINPNLYNNSSIGDVAGPMAATCSATNAGELITTKLTSGYYNGEDRVPQIVGKCRHGGPTDFGSFAGINKDFSDTLFSPHGALNGRAVNLAIMAGVQFLKDFRAQNANEARTKKVFNVP